MKAKLYLAVLVVSILALVIMGCGEKEEKTDQPTTGKVEGTTGDEVIEKVEVAFETMKSEYLEKAGKLVSGWDEKLISLEEKKKDLPAITRKPLENTFKAVVDNKADVDTKLTDLKGAGEDTFNAKKEAFEGSLNVLKTGYDDLLGKL
ncbi:MAG: hypothetical protein GY841_03905 [FCB group bacterium]|nr:hypothetical protein [FCB group bacterium]